MKIRFLGRKKLWWLLLSALIMVPGIVALFTWKLPLGIDFKGGALFDIEFSKNVSQTDLQQKLAGYSEVKGVTVAKTGERTYSIKTLPVTDEQRGQVITDLKKDFGDLTEKQFQSVGPSVSQDLTKKAILAVVYASILILLYLAYAFRTVVSPLSSWRFGTTALAALLHDLVITAGVFAILAHFLHYEIDSSFITALLTVMGFSVHDTIVVFDRIRENVMKSRITEASDFEQLADVSLGDTLNRSLSTSLTVIFTLLALTLLGGESIRPFVVTLLIGITIGTYSSIFTATPLLVLWQNRVFAQLARSS